MPASAAPFMTPLVETCSRLAPKLLGSEHKVTLKLARSLRRHLHPLQAGATLISGRGTWKCLAESGKLAAARTLEAAKMWSESHYARVRGV